MQNQLRNALETGFIDKTFASYTYYQPKLIVNDKKQKKKILSTLLYELEHCESFVFSVAFLSKSGVAVLINTLENLKLKGIKGQVLVSQYLNFTQPEALKTLMGFENIDLRIVTHGDFHAKGYFFKHANHHAMIVGSSNLTAPALTTNKEWNLYVCAMDASKLIDESLNIFYEEFEKAHRVDADFIKHYENVYKYQAKMTLAADPFEGNYGAYTPLVFKPNAMQEEAMQSLMKLRLGHGGKSAQNKAMIISATGTGKTYLSVFDAQNYNPKRLLFVVHRGTIARSAMESYQKVFGDTKTMGLFSGQHKNTHADFVFSTVQTLAKEENLQQFDRAAFDYIVIDESHHAGAESYQKILAYFTPKFLLGMTATPERTDGYNVFSDFDHNIAFEVRLNRALDEDMLCPFHYYGVTDLCTENGDDAKTAFLKLTADERVTQIIEKSKFYGTDTGEIYGLVFCNKTEVAKELSRKFNQRGYRTLALTGSDNEDAREKAINRLEGGKGDEKLDYIFTVDIFNEGIDIPKVNQIIMLRPTQSAIVFVQQLGRGLRKTENKEYLTVIDFIGNYQNNYLIPVALYGDATYDKDKLRKLIAGGSAEIPGACTVNFDKISKDQIFKAIDSANMQQKKDLDRDYDLLKFKLGHSPSMMDFVVHGSREPMLYVTYAKSYYNYVAKREKDMVALDFKAMKLLECFGLYIANGKRYEDIFVLENLLKQGPLTHRELIELSKESPYLKPLDDVKLGSVFRNLNFYFMKESQDKKQVAIGEKYGFALLNHKAYTETNHFELDECFKRQMQNETFRQYFMDQLYYGKTLFTRDYDPKQDFAGFILYRKYSRRDVFRILGWDENPVAQNVGGYMVHKDKRDCAIFVNYHKSDDISSTTKYEDGFVSPDLFQWMSKSKRTLESPDVVAIGNFHQNGMRLPLFIKKHNDEGLEFYYMGDVTPIPEAFEQTTMQGDNEKMVSVVKMMVKLHVPVMEEMYRYIVEGDKVD